MRVVSKERWMFADIASLDSVVEESKFVFICLFEDSARCTQTYESAIVEVDGLSATWDPESNHCYESIPFNHE